jgi:hypothetical protein
MRGYCAWRIFMHFMRAAESLRFFALTPIASHFVLRRSTLVCVTTRMSRRFPIGIRLALSITVCVNAVRQCGAVQAAN